MSMYENFLPQTLANGRFVAAPDRYAVEKRLGYPQDGLDLS